MNWKAPRNWPPPPMAWGSPPDSHSAVERAHWRSLRVTLDQRVSYFEAWTEGLLAVAVPPEPGARARGVGRGGEREGDGEGAGEQGDREQQDQPCSGARSVVSVEGVHLGS